jgi:hypothetical protein
MKKIIISFISIGLIICVFGGVTFAIEIEWAGVFREKRVFEPGAFTGVTDREMMVASAIVDLGTLDPDDYEVYLTSSSGMVTWYLPKYKQYSGYSDTSWEYSYAFLPTGPEWEEVTYTFELVYASNKGPVGVPTKASNIYSGDVTDPVPIPDWVDISGDCSELQLEWENVLENDCEEKHYKGNYRIRVYPLNPDGSFNYRIWLFRSERFPCPDYTLTDLSEGCKSYAIGVESNINYSGAPPLGEGLVNRSQYYFRYDACMFADVPPGYWAAEYIYKIYSAGITTGCSATPLMYCPNKSVTRAQMAVFLERGIHGSNYTPPAASGIFDDVPVNYWAAAWIEQLYNEGITGGCGTNPLRYCPASPVTRAQMAVFLLRAEYGGGYTPPAASGIFADVPVTHWAAAWIEQLYNEGITGGCGTNPLRYCPDNPVTRAQMAVFLVRTFDL